MRLWLLSLALAVSFTSVAARCAEENADEAANKKYLEDKRKQREEILGQRVDLEKKLEETKQKINAQSKEAAKLGSATVTIDEETKEVAEPQNAEAALNLKTPIRDPYEPSPEDVPVYVHDRWSVNLSDFRIDDPQYISAEMAHGSSKTWFGFTFTLTNSTGKTRRIAPFLTAVTNHGVYNHAVGGFTAERRMADSLGRPLMETKDLRDKELLTNYRVAPLESNIRLADYAIDPATGAARLDPMATFEPGQSRWGAALWTNFTNEFTELKIIVNGISNAHRYDEKMRRVLVMTFERLDDEFHVHRSQLKFKGKKWEYLWMWDQSITVPVPTDAKNPQIKVQTLKTPSGVDKLAWAFPFKLDNPSRSTQEIAINSVSYVCPIEIDIGGQKVPVEVKIVDDGRSTIYKAQLLKAIGKESPKDRFELNKTPGGTEGSKTRNERRKTSIEAGKGLDELWAVFDSSDVDWDDLKVQLESALSQKQDKAALAKDKWAQIVKNVAPDNKALAEKNPGFLYDPRRLVTPDEMKAVQEQVAKALPVAIDAAKAKKTVVAYFDCTSGLSTGSYRVSRSYRQLGVVQDEWLKAWEELDRAAPAAPSK